MEPLNQNFSLYVLLMMHYISPIFFIILCHKLSKINIDNKTCIDYLDSYRFAFIDASICWATTEAGTQFSIFA